MVSIPDRMTPLDIEIPEEFDKVRETGKAIKKNRPLLKAALIGLVALGVTLGPGIRWKNTDDARAGAAEVLAQGAFEQRIAQKSKSVSERHGVETKVRMSDLNVITPVDLRGKLPDEALSPDGELVTDSGTVSIFEHGSGQFYTFFGGERGYYSGKSEKGAVGELQQSWEFANEGVTPPAPKRPDADNGTKLASLY